jgi:hypothetical protein
VLLAVGDKKCAKRCSHHVRLKCYDVFYIASGGSTVVVHMPHHSKAACSSLVGFDVIRR